MGSKEPDREMNRAQREQAARVSLTSRGDPKRLKERQRGTREGEPKPRIHFQYQAPARTLKEAKEDG